MDFDEACDEVDRIVTSLDQSPRIDALRKGAADLQVGEDGRAEFLAALAGELWVTRDWTGARDAATAAIDDGGPTVHEPRCILLSVELDAGNHEQADEVLAGFLADARAGTITIDECEWIADALEHVGRHRDALRWYTIPLRDIDPRDVESLPTAILHARWRVRRGLDLPLDAYDETSALLQSVDGRG